MPLAIAPGNFRALVDFTPASPTAMAQAIKDVLVNACGWSVISGSNPTWVLKSATSSEGLAMRVRMQLSGGGLGLVPQYEDGSVEGYENRLNTAAGFGVKWRIIANQYQFFVLVPGVTSSTALNDSTLGGTFCCMGILALPTFLNGVVTRAIYSNQNWTPYFGRPYEDSFRTAPAFGRQTFFWNVVNGQAYGSDSSDGATLGKPRLSVMGGAQTDQRLPLRWLDQKWFLSEPEYCMSINGNINSEARKVGLIWDGVYISDSRVAPVDTVVNFNGANWYVLMSNQLIYGSTADGALWVRIP